MPALDLERRLLSSIRTWDELDYCQREGITELSFDPPASVGLHPRVWTYLCEHAREHAGALPTDEDLRSLFDFEVEAPGDVRTYARMVKQRELGRRLGDLLLRSSSQLGEDGRPAEEVVKALTRALTELQVGGRRRVTYLDRDALERLKRYDEIAQDEGLREWIPTGLDVFDRRKLYLRPGHLFIVVGSTGVGKSWLLTHMAATAYEHGKKLLIMSPEMTSEEQGYRFDVMLARRREVVLSNMDLITGQGDRAIYKRWLTDLAGHANFGCVDATDSGRPMSYDDCWRYALEERPDVLIVDGLHLLAGFPGKRGWEVIKEGAQNLKALAQQEHVVVLASHQLVRSASDKDATKLPTLADTAYGFGSVEAADYVVGMARVTGDELARKCRVLKTRAGGGPNLMEPFQLKWNVDVGEVFQTLEQPTSYPDDENEF